MLCPLRFSLLFITLFKAAQSSLKRDQIGINHHLSTRQTLQAQVLGIDFNDTSQFVSSLIISPELITLCLRCAMNPASCPSVAPCSLFGHTEEEYIPDAESVYLHREQHHQPQACTLAQCFQLYTKEEQVPAGGVHRASRTRTLPRPCFHSERINPDLPQAWTLF